MRIVAGLMCFACSLLLLVKPIFPSTTENAAHRTMVVDQDVLINNRRLQFEVDSLFVSPGEEVLIEYDPDVFSKVRATEGNVAIAAKGRGRWNAPSDPNASPTLFFEQAHGTDAIQVNVFVLVPGTDMFNGTIGDYRIDEYPSPAGISTDADYSKPVGFVKVSATNQERLVSPHFTIGQFVSKQEGDWPKYVVPGPKLYVQLEQILADVNEQGFRAKSLTIMSGYRTPYYNASIGNVPYSRHIYGDAADIFVDLDDDYRMDDLNGDGIINRADAEVLAGWVDFPTEVSADEDDGGLGVYAPKAWRGPFVHVDTRGTRARWIQ